MTRGQRKPLPAGVTPAWTYVAGVGASRVVVYEDLARDRQLTLRWWDPKRENWRRKSLGRTLERNRRGEIVRASEAWAQEAATVKSAALIKGTPEEAVVLPQRFTIGDTEKAITDPETGKYPHDTPFRQELIRALDYAATVWGKDTPWATIDDEAWTKLIRRRLESLLLQGKVGVRTTEITVSRLNTAATWLRRRKKITRDAALLPPDWRAELLEHWRGVTKATRDPQPSRPRHTLEQLRKLLVSAEEVDPRLGLLLQLGAEYRLGQVVRSRRTDLDVEARTLFVHGRGKKGGETIALTDGQMAAVRRALGGYLREDEERFLAKGTDYLLFPSGRLKRWREDVPRLGDGVDRTKPLSRRWIIKNFHLAEDMAGVPRVKGRAAYGLRRQNVDAANAAGISRHGLQASGGWSSTKVADEVYRDQENQLGREEARRVRAKTRGEEE